MLPFFNFYHFFGCASRVIFIKSWSRAHLRIPNPQDVHHVEMCGPRICPGKMQAFLYKHISRMLWKRYLGLEIGCVDVPCLLNRFRVGVPLTTLLACAQELIEMVLSRTKEDAPRHLVSTLVTWQFCQCDMHPTCSPCRAIRAKVLTLMWTWAEATFVLMGCP